MLSKSKQTCEESSDEGDGQRSQLCVVAGVSLSKEHAKFLVTWSRLPKVLRDSHHRTQNEIIHTSDHISNLNSDIISLHSDATHKATPTTRTPQSTLPQWVAHYITSSVVPSLQASDYHQVVQLLQQLPQRGPPSTALRGVILLGCGLAYSKMGRFQEATKVLRELVEVCGEEEDMRGTRSLACVYLGDMAASEGEAEGYYEQAVALHSEDSSLGRVFSVPLPPLSHLANKWGQALRKASKVMQAIAAFKKAIATATDKKQEMSARTSLGNTFQSLGNHQGAVEEYKVTISLSEELRDYVSLGWNHGNIGNAYLSSGDKDRALHHLKLSLDLTLEHETTPSAISRAYNNLGTVHQSLGDLGEGQRYYQLALNQAVFGQDMPGQARAHGNLGNISMLRKDYEAAYRSYSEAIHLSSDVAMRTTALHNRGCCLYEKAEERRVKFGLSPEVKELYGEAAVDLKMVVQHNEDSLHTIKGSPKGLSLSVSLFDAHYGTFQKLVDSLYSCGRSQEALEVAEQCRARTIGELLLRKRSWLLTTPISYKHMCTIVQSQSCTVVYFAYTGCRMIMWVLAPVRGGTTVATETIHVDLNKDLFNGKTLDFHLRYDITNLIAHQDFELFGYHDYKNFYPVHQLYDVLGKPLLQAIRRVQGGGDKLHDESHDDGPHDLVLIPDSHAPLPLSVLCDISGPSFLGDHFTSVRTMPSILVMATLIQPPLGQHLKSHGEVGIIRNSDHFCIVGDPNIPPYILNGEEVFLGRLPHAALEAQWVADTLGTTATIGNQATKQNVVRQLQGAQVVHIATHGGGATGFLAFADGRDPHGPHPVEADKVLLLPHEVEQMSLSAQLVVLSSCSSACGRVSGEGVISMARACLLAGAQSILTTLWPVPDESAGVFMKFFYQHLMEGVPSPQALQKAVHSLRFIKKYSKYVHWGGYQLMGRGVQFEPLPRDDDDVINDIRGSSYDGPTELLTALGSALFADCDHTSIYPDHTSIYPDHTPVQIIHSSPDVDPMGCVLHFICRHHHHYKAIFYITGALEEHLEIAEISIKETLPLMVPTDNILVALDNIKDISSLPGDLLALLKRPSTSIIILHASPAPPTSVATEVSTLLLKGCSTHTLPPLTHTQCSQRMAHDVVSRTNLVPMNKEQEVMSLLCDLTRGSPVLVDLMSEVACEYLHSQGDPIGGLMRDVVVPSSGTPVVHTTSLLLRALRLDNTEHTTLCSLAMFGPCPLPHAFVMAVVNVIMSGLPPDRQHPDEVLQQLLKRQLVRLYPNVVMKPQSSRTSRMYYVPQLVIEGALYGMKEVDVVFATAIAQKAIVRGRQGDQATPHTTPTTVTSLHSVAQSRGLLQTVMCGPLSGQLAPEVYSELMRPVMKRYG